KAGCVRPVLAAFASWPSCPRRHVRARIASCQQSGLRGGPRQQMELSVSKGCARAIGPLGPSFVSPPPLRASRSKAAAAAGLKRGRVSHQEYGACGHSADLTPASLSANFFSHFEAGQKFDVTLLASDAALADAFFFL